MKKTYNEPFVQYCEVSAFAIMVGSEPDPESKTTPSPGDSFSSAPRHL